TGARILLNSGPAPVDGNAVYGNSVGIEISGFISGYVITNNLVYANTNQGIYVHNAGTSGSTGVQLINNTVHHDVGSAIRIENNGPNVRLFNNIIVINGGLGIEVIGNAGPPPSTPRTARSLPRSTPTGLRGSTTSAR